jgi:hypothetical protein
LVIIVVSVVKIVRVVKVILSLTTVITSSTNNLFFQYKPVDQFPDDACKKHNDRNGIYYMHYLKIKTGWPVWVFLPEKIHKQI